ncbi:MAG: tetratricopeptide repeat protein [Bacteroidaceae bacterium]|nr:tetratricopeptide repeat protein [Bacteroidaceae bacterium]
MATNKTNAALRKQPAHEEQPSKWEEFFKKNKKMLLYVLCGIVLVIAGILLYHNFVAKPRAEKAATALGACQELFNQQQFDKALKGDGAAVIGFIRVADDFGSTPSGNLANYYAGLCYTQMGKWQEAVNYLEKFDPQDDQIVSPQSQMVLGDAYANVKQYDKAVDAFKRAAKLADKADVRGINTSVSPLALRKAGVVLNEQGKKDEALQLFKEIKQKYVASPIALDIDKYIELVTK